MCLWTTPVFPLMKVCTGQRKSSRVRIEAYGVSSNYRNYVGQSAMDTREVLARVKDFAVCIFKPEPTYLGEAIPIWGDGNLTNDENSDIS